MNKNRVSPRLQTWDYGWDAAYFITICTHNRAHCFGNITNGKMHLSPVGVVADILWHEIKNHAQNVQLGAFVVMPNHVHGILILNGNNVGGGGGGDGGKRNVGTGQGVGTGPALSLPEPLQPPGSPLPPADSPLQTSKTIGQQTFAQTGKNTVPLNIGRVQTGRNLFINPCNQGAKNKKTPARWPGFLYSTKYCYSSSLYLTLIVIVVLAPVATVELTILMM
ncbi:MAG: hypothetical protein HC896_18910 [Bacteroidales bacterium]|nr:hypothetical protein [Bacteroidales bacterium]